MTTLLHHCFRAGARLSSPGGRVAWLLSALLLNAIRLVAQPTVLSTQPQAAAPAAASRTYVTAFFSQTMGAASNTAMKVFSAQAGGLKIGGGQVNGKRLTFIPTTRFKAGETVMATVRTTAENSVGVNLTTPYVLQFTTATKPTSANFTGGSNPVMGPDNNTTVVSGDVNGDGDLDMLTCKITEGEIWLALGNGDGTFGTATMLPAVDAPNRLALADLNGDGDLDLLATNLVANTVSVFVNNGSGSFALNGTVAVGQMPIDVATGDVDGDGDLDFVVSNQNGNSVSVRFNNGSGTFSGVANVSVGIIPAGVALGDVDGDGDLDLLATSQTNNSVSVRLNNGSGTFSGGSNVSVGSRPMDLALGDVDRDGDLDFVTCNYDGNNVSVRLNTGSGNFVGGPNASVGNEPIDVVLGDVDGDGDLDLATANKAGASASVRLNSGNGTFINGSTVSSLAGAGVALADLDNDQDLDLLLADNDNAVIVKLNRNSPFEVTNLGPARNQPNTPPGTSVAVTFSQAVSQANPLLNSLTLFGSYRGMLSAAGSVVGNVLVRNPSLNFLPGETIVASLATAISGGGQKLDAPEVFQFTAAAGAGPGTFTQAPALTTAPGSGSGDVAVGDLDGDGNLDLVGTKLGSNAIGIWQGNGDGTFGPQTSVAVGGGPIALALADLNTDGHLDIVYLRAGSATVAYLANNGNGAFVAGGSIAVDGVPNALAVGDIDGDGDPDVLTSSLAGQSVSVRPISGNGTLLAGYELPIGVGAEGLTLADMDNDGDLDLLLGNAAADDDMVGIRFNNGNGYFDGGSEVKVGDRPRSLAVGDIDSDGDLDLITANNAGNTVSVRFNLGTFIGLGTNLATSAPPTTVKLADVDGDGDLDLLVGCSSGTVQLHRNNGSGVFGASVDFNGGPNLLKMAVGDLDNDGDLDFAAANNLYDKFSILLNEVPLHITALSPTRNRRHAPAGSNVNVTFDQFISNSPSSLGSVRVFGSQRGGLLNISDGTASVAGNSTIAFAPTTPFRPGETVFTTITTAARSNLGSYLAAPQVYQFTAAAGVGPGTFVAAPSIPTGTDPHYVALADVNDDGNLDIFATSGINETVTLYLGTGAGTFGAGTVVSNSAQAGHLLTADIDGDGDLDLLTRNFGGAVNIHRNSGTGGFGSPTTVNLPELTYFMTVGDVDGDGDLDIVSTGDSGNASIQLNDGNGTFSFGNMVDVGGNRPAVLGDLDGDGDLDLVSPYRVRFNNGAGIFGGGYALTSGSEACGTQLGDLDGDGDLDLVVAASGDHTVWLRFNNGSGTFGPQMVYAAPGTRAFNTALADVDGDGDLDILVDGSVTALLRNNGNGVFAAATSFPTPFGFALATGDLDNDGDLDFVTANVDDNELLVRLNATPLTITTLSPTRNRRNAATGADVAVTFNQPLVNNTLVAAAVRVFSSQRGGRVAGAASVAGSTITLNPSVNFRPGETVFSTITTAPQAIGGGGLAKPQVYQFTAATTGGTGTFVPGSDPAVASPVGVALGDVDGDGDLDIVTANRDLSNTASVRLNNGNGTYTSAPDVATGIMGFALALGDVDADGDLDMVVTSYSMVGIAVVRLNDGSGNFTGNSSVAVGPLPTQVLLADVDGDGDLDMLTANNGASTVSVRLNDGSGAFGGGSDPGSNGPTGSLVVGDIDGDGDLDLISAGTTSNLASFRRNNGSGTFGAGGVPGVGSTPTCLALADIDGDGDLDLLAGSNDNAVNIRLNNGTGTFSNGGTVPVAAGVDDVAAGDVDGDGDLDLLVSNDGTVSVRLNNGAGVFGGGSDLLVDAQANELALGDVDGDGDLDYVTASEGSNLVNVRLNGTATLPDLIVSTVTPVTGGPYNNVTVTGTGFGTLAANLSVAGTLLIEDGGVLNDGCFTITGPGSFVLEAGGSLGICSPQGITLAGATGTVQVAGLRSYSTDASYTYNGAALQVTGDGLPADVRNLTAANPAHVRLSNDLAVRRVLVVRAGNLKLGASNLLLPSDADGTALVVNSLGGIVENDGSGTATMQRHITLDAQQPYTGPGYRHYSAPMQSSRVADLATTGFAPQVNPAYNALPAPALLAADFPNVFGYQESRLTASYPGFDTGWASPAALTDPLALTQGYTVNIAPAAKVALTGTLNTGLLNTGALGRGFGAEAGWHLLGNPYPAPLDWKLVTATPGAIPAGLDDAVYVFEPTSQYGGFYRSFVNGIGTQGFNGVLPAMQGFFVRATQAVPAGFDFRDAFRLTQYANPAFHRQAAGTQPLLRLALSGSTGGTDETVVYLEPGATATGTDARFDAAKLPNPGRSISLASLMPGAGNAPLAINGLPVLTASTTRVPLQLTLPAAGTYTFTRTTLTGFDPAQPVTLVDHATGTQTDLHSTASYAFTTTQAGLLNGRFELLLSRPGTVTATTATPSLAFSVWPNPATQQTALHLSLAAPATQATATLHNVLGQVVATKSFSGSAAELPTLGLATGTYLLTVRVPGLAPATRRVVLE